MKVMAFNARPDERAFFDHFSQSLDMDLTLQKDTLTLDNVALTRGYDGISCTCDLPAPILEKLAENGVRYVALRTIGYDNVDLKAAERLGIRVSHAGYSPYAVSNYTVMLMLMCIRKAGYIMFRSHTADYSLGASGAARGMEMQNLTVGVIGTGRIGKAVIHNLSGFGCRIIAHDPYPSEEMKQMGVEYVSLESLYAQSDVITLHTFLNDSTYHMINTEAIQQMKPGVVIINCARGALIDTRALIDGIESGRVGSVGVDCFEGEDGVIRVDHNYNGRVTNHDYIILKSFQNTIVTPHVAFFTDQAVFDMVQCSLESLHQFELGEKVPLEVHAARSVTDLRHLRKIPLQIRSKRANALRAEPSERLHIDIPAALCVLDVQQAHACVLADLPPLAGRDQCNTHAARQQSNLQGRAVALDSGVHLHTC